MTDIDKDAERFIDEEFARAAKRRAIFRAEARETALQTADNLSKIECARKVLVKEKKEEGAG